MRRDRAAKAALIRTALVCVSLALGGTAQAEPGPAAERALCEDYRTVEQAALEDFRPLADAPARNSPLASLAARLLASRPLPTTLALPDANACDLRPSMLRARKKSYSCLWKSAQPDLAAADQAQRIAGCLGSEVTKSDFGTDLEVVTATKVRFRLIIEHGYDGPDGYAVRLWVDGPQL
jgi:hypothetical protein